MERGRSADNFLKLYFDTELFTEDEAKNAMAECGSDIDEIEKKRVDFLRKIEAKEKLAEGSLRREAFEKMRREEQSEGEKEGDTNYRIAARNGENEMGEEEMGRDKMLFEKIKKELGKK